MKIVKPSFTIEYPATSDEWLREVKLIESTGRVSHKSEDRITDDSWRDFIKMLIRMKHFAALEFGNMVVRFVTDRGIMSELTRHRLCSFMVESTRYCDYSKDKFGKEITFIKPSGITSDRDYAAWCRVCECAEYDYKLISGDTTAQVARSVLPNCTKTEIVMKCDFTELRHIFQLRAIEKAAHPDMRALMIPLYEECRKLCPEVFDMGEVE